MTLTARLLEGAPNETQAEAAATNPAMAAVLGWPDVQQTARIYQMTDDAGVKETLRFNLGSRNLAPAAVAARHRAADRGRVHRRRRGLAARGAGPARTFYSFHDGSTAGEGRWAQGKTLLDQDIVFAQGAPLAEDDGSLPAPDPLLFGTYDGTRARDSPAPAEASTAAARGCSTRPRTGSPAAEVDPRLADRQRRHLELYGGRRAVTVWAPAGGDRPRCDRLTAGPEPAAPSVRPASRARLMALLDRAAGLLVTAAPGTGSTALRAALLSRSTVTRVPASEEVRLDGVDTKHATVTQLVAAGLLDADHGLRVVTTTRNPFDYYVAEYERTRTRWVHELRRPDSWVHVTPGAVDRIVDAVTLDFESWLSRAVGPQARVCRVNAGHVDEADVVLRMEHLEADLRDLLDLDLTVAPVNVTDRERAWWRGYSVAARCLVEQAHADELARFGYRF